MSERNDNMKVVRYVITGLPVTVGALFTAYYMTKNELWGYALVALIALGFGFMFLLIFGFITIVVGEWLTEVGLPWLGRKVRRLR